jgi:hypothetical protein
VIVGVTVYVAEAGSVPVVVKQTAKVVGPDKAKPTVASPAEGVAVDPANEVQVEFADKLTVPTPLKLPATWAETDASDVLVLPSTFMADPSLTAKVPIEATDPVAPVTDDGTKVTAPVVTSTP